MYLCEKKEKNVRGDEPDHDTIGETLVWQALKPDTKLCLASHVGKDGAQDADIFIGRIKQVSDGQSPFFTSDGRSYREALTKHCGPRKPVVPLGCLVVPDLCPRSYFYLAPAHIPGH